MVGGLIFLAAASILIVSFSRSTFHQTVEIGKMTPTDKHLSALHKADRVEVWKRRAGLVFALFLALSVAGWAL